MNTSKSSAFVVIFVILMIAGSVALAQDTTPVAPQKEGTCFRGQPHSRCQTFWVLEFSYFRRLDDKPRGSAHDPGKWLMTGDIGHMYNLSPTSSVGATLYFGGDDDAGRFGIIPRYRFWFRPDSRGRQSIRIDLAAGPLLSISDNYLKPKPPGFMGSIGINFEDWLALTLLTEVIRYEGKQGFRTIEPVTDVGVYVGMIACSYAAPIGLAVLIVAAIISSAADSGPSF